MKITGLDKLNKTLKQIESATAAIDGDIAELIFDPSNPSSIEAAISEMYQAVDERLGPYRGNLIVDQLSASMKENFEKQVWDKVNEEKMTTTENDLPQSTVGEVLEEFRDAILDMRQADHQNFDRPAKKLSRLLNGDSLKPICDKLTDGLELDSWLSAGMATGGSFVGSKTLTWPDNDQEQLGYVILLAHCFADGEMSADTFAFNFYYAGTNINANLRNMLATVFVPFERDFAKHVRKVNGDASKSTDQKVTAKNLAKVFIVHGHDGGAKEAVARVLGKLNLQPIILHEQINKGQTIIEKFEANADVGFAVVLLTPDDFGGAQGKESSPRARQNVILELGYFMGRLGRQRVMALKRKDLEIPSDMMGVVYTEYDEAGAWKLTLAIELQAAGYTIDLNKLGG